MFSETTVSGLPFFIFSKAVSRACFVFSSCASIRGASLDHVTLFSIDISHSVNKWAYCNISMSGDSVELLRIITPFFPSSKVPEKSGHAHV